MKFIKIAKNPYLRLALNISYAFGNCVIGFFVRSWWFITLGAYYSVLSLTRFSVLNISRKANGDRSVEVASEKVSGILLILLSVCLIGVNILSAVTERGKDLHEIVMIAVATYTFTKIIAAIVGMAKAKNIDSPVVKTLRNISLADACVSIYSMQRSMLVSFPGMDAPTIKLFNILTGSAVYMTVLLLGINLIGGKRVNMAKSKIVKANEKIAGAVESGYKTIEKGVVKGYKKVEESVVKGYTKIEDKFVEKYLTRDGESVKEAKERLKKEKK